MSSKNSLKIRKKCIGDNFNEKQTTISKFFPSAFKRKAATGDVVVIGDDYDDTNKDQHSGGHLSKKLKLDTSSAGGNPQVNQTLSVLKERSQTKVHVKEKLQHFSAINVDDIHTEGIKSFDFNCLKRKSAASILEAATSKLNAATDILNEDGKKVHESECAMNTLDQYSSAKCKTDKGKQPSRSKVTKSLSVKFTPLEQQYIEFRDKYKDAVLFIECGYKYRFFGKDAEIASKLLKIYAHHDHNFLTASIPVHRLFVHVSRIVSAGYKVGVVQQTETAALKAAGSNKNTPFTRQLTALYTKSTMIGEDIEMSNDLGETTSSISMATNYLVCICEQEVSKGDQKIFIGIMGVQPSTGDIIYDSFTDTGSRIELETRLTHLQPVEVILPSNISMETEKLLNGFQTICNHGDNKMRIEKIDSGVFRFNEAFNEVSRFYQQNVSTESTSLQTVINLPQPVICCLAGLIEYLQDFKLEKILREVSNFSQFSTKSSYMQLDGCTVRNLEIFHNVTNQSEYGSLYWVMNHTVTPAGARLLRTWLSRPLLSTSDIERRQEAVAEILNNNLHTAHGLRATISRLPDIEKRLASAYHKKCRLSDFYGMCEALLTVCDTFSNFRKKASDTVTSKLLLSIMEEVPDLLSDVKELIAVIDGKAAKENDKTNMFINGSIFPDVIDCKEKITRVKKEILDHRREVRLTVHQPSLEYCTVLGTEFLIEVKNSNISLVPNDWTKISSTKAVSRFHTPVIVEKYKLLQQYREQLIIESNSAWIQFLECFSERYPRYRKAVHHVSTLDCLFSLAVVAQQQDFVRPEIVDGECCIEVERGRHPVIQELIGENKQYVANDTNLSTSGKHVMVITGPNMGGKSCYIRQVAILSLLAQIGSYVPAESAKFGILDAIYTRMGAADDIYHGRSTFMVELQEASEIMAKAKSRSLVILDELGRGTSTHDGVAIAHAVLDFFISKPKYLTLFVTHYPSLSEFETTYPGRVGNFHMSFVFNDEDSSSDDNEKITFLYELVAGVAARSYGLNVARMAGIPEHILDVATTKSRTMENIEHSNRSKRKMLQKLLETESPTLLRQVVAKLNS